MDKMTVGNVMVTVPAGEYWLGDPCYSFDAQDRWMELLHSCDFFNNPIGTVEVDGKELQVLGFQTAYGDGLYKGSDGNLYPVDAGLIGLVPVELCPDADPGLAQKVVFDKRTECSSIGGELSFGTVTIDTDTDTDHDDEEDEEDGDPWADEDGEDDD